MSTIYVVITGTKGSSPRDAGTAMAVTPDATEGTIGGGALEHQAITRARTLLSEGREAEETIPLGPGLGQCCGGAVRLKYTFQQHTIDIPPLRVMRIEPDRPHPRHLWLWGAGHVGRAFVRVAHPQAFRITWVDESPERFPARVPEHIRMVPAADMPRLAARAEKTADHLIFTYSHEIDLALCAALLRRGVRSIGLIGSETKKSRFFKRLRDMGLDPDTITCPIGDKARGKLPEAIAEGTLAGWLSPRRGAA